ncbi:MAG: MFS transporter [Desulfovibrionaceae bacterium CG1_02_65_16]|nr:MAG: MFS transporter [Desulfovibrionaceae bacterium CG1_02_65_16]
MNETGKRRGRLAVLSVAHLFNDWYMNFIQTLLPFFVLAGMGVSRGAFLVSAFTTTSSLLQPIFGYLADRRGQRWIVYVGTVWMALLLGLLGVTTSYARLLALALLAGLGTAAFHPQAAAMVGTLAGARKGWHLAVFAAAGNVGWALTPLIVVPVVTAQGLGITPLFILPGVLAAMLLWVAAPRVAAATSATAEPFLPALRSVWCELLKIVLVVSLRSLAYFGLIAFLPLHMQARGINLTQSGRLLFLMLLSGAVGGMLGGSLSDRFGRKVVTIVSLALSTPLFLWFFHSSGPLSVALLCLAGAALLASFSVTVALAQELISRNAAIASGLTLGFGIGMGGLGVGLVGMFIERAGVDAAVSLLAWCPLAAGLLALLLRPRAASANAAA